MFDLPTETPLDRRRYRWFRKFLVEDGFVMMQESIYTKICINMHAVKKVELNVRKHCPSKGLVQVITVTERQYMGMRIFVGEQESSHIQSDERMVIL